MASISSDKNGHKRILVILPDGSRKCIRLGRCSLRYAESFRVRVADLVSAKTLNTSPLDETCRWLADLEDKLLAKLIKLDLAKPRASVSLEAFIDGYISGRVDVKPGTQTNYGQIRRYIFGFFDGKRFLRDIGPGDAEDFRLHLVKLGLADNTIRRVIGRSRQFFKAAIRRGLIQSNPFDGMAAAVRANMERFYFVSRDEADKVLEACPDAEWRLIFALCRYGGLRCPTEVLSLKWTDVDWDRNRIRITSPKTEAYEGGGSRMIPMFPELQKPLLDVFSSPDPGDYVITRYRQTNVNLRTQLQRIIRRAGLEPWPKLFQNLRSTRETELAERFPIHVVCKWIGNSPAVAAQHYLQLTDEHFSRAVQADAKPEDPQDEAAQNAAQNEAQKPAEGSGSDSKTAGNETLEAFETAGVYADTLASAKTCENEGMTPTGFEPVLPA